VPIIQLATAGR